jgi:SAM-dependent methyltransferase
VNHGDKASSSGTFTHTAYANEWFYRAKFARLREVLRENRITLTNARVLDAACGPGRFIPILSNLGAKEIVGIDISPVAVSLCEEKQAEELKVGFLCHDLVEEFPADYKNQYDLVCIFEAIFCIVDSRSFEIALRHLAQAVKPGGYLLISDHFPKEEERPNHRIAYHSLDAYSSILASEGLKIQGLHLQTKVFNKQILPRPFQRFVENRIPWTLYILDRFLLRLPKVLGSTQSSIYYCVAKKKLL